MLLLNASNLQRAILVRTVSSQELIQLLYCASEFLTLSAKVIFQLQSGRTFVFPPFMTPQPKFRLTANLLFQNSGGFFGNKTV